MATEARPIDRLAEHGRELRDSGQTAMGAASHALSDLAEVAQDELESRPWFTLGLAFGSGLLLGGGLPPKVVSGAAGFGLRLAVAQVARRIVNEAAEGPAE